MKFVLGVFVTLRRTLSNAVQALYKEVTSVSNAYSNSGLGIQ